eukprot:1160066-Pelagomonas_calceolata.AAC.12
MSFCASSLSARHSCGTNKSACTLSKHLVHFDTVVSFGGTLASLPVVAQSPGKPAPDDAAADEVALGSPDGSVQVCVHGLVEQGGWPANELM